MPPQLLRRGWGGNLIELTLESACGFQEISNEHNEPIETCIILVPTPDYPSLSMVAIVEFPCMVH